MGSIQAALNLPPFSLPWAQLDRGRGSCHALVPVRGVASVALCTGHTAAGQLRAGDRAQNYCRRQGGQRDPETRACPIVPHRNNHDQCVERRWRGRSVGCIGGSTVRHAEGAGHVDTVTAPTESRSREETIASYLLGVHPDPVGSAPAASEKLSNRGWGNDPEVEASAGPDSGWTANPYAISAWRRRGLAGGCGEVRTTRWVHDRRGQERTREDRRGQDRREGAHTDLRVQIQYSTE